MISPGEIWKEKIIAAISTTKVAVLLVSPYFLESDFIAKHELPPLLKAAEDEDVPIFWIYLSPCLYDQTEIGRYQAAHDLGKALNELRKPQREAALRQICDRLVKVTLEGPAPQQTALTSTIARSRGGIIVHQVSPPITGSSPAQSHVPTVAKRQIRFVKEAHPHIGVFISHAREDNVEALQHRDALDDAKFNVWKYDAKPNPAHSSAVEPEIKSREFFVLLFSGISPTKSLLQRELGLAAALQRRNRGYLPLIITLLSRNMRWNHENMPTIFPTMDFHTGNPGSALPLDTCLVPASDNFTAHNQELIDYMRPQLLISRMDFSDRDVFYDTDVFTLYEDLFPASERDNPNDIIDWVLDTDIGQSRSVKLNDDVHFVYRIDSRYCILTLAKKAIGLAFLTYDYRYSIMFGNYIAVQESWRSHGLADAFARKIREALAQEGLFQGCRGTVFEVEPFDKAEIYRIISYLEEPANKKQFHNSNDYDQIRRFLRVNWYESMGYKFFFSGSQKADPIVCTAPYLDPDSELPVSEWASQQEDYWLMWKGEDNTIDPRNTGTIWQDCVKCVYIEILAKSLVERCSSNGPAYWKYVNDVVGNVLNLHRDAEIRLGSYVRKEYDLFRRWRALKIPIAI